MVFRLATYQILWMGESHHKFPQISVSSKMIVLMHILGVFELSTIEFSEKMKNHPTSGNRQTFFFCAGRNPGAGASSRPSAGYPSVGYRLVCLPGQVLLQAWLNSAQLSAGPMDKYGLFMCQASQKGHLARQEVIVGIRPY